MEQKLTAVLCVLNSKYIHSSLAPWCLLAGVEAYCEEGINAEVVEGTINEKLEDVLRRITEHKPEVVGFSCYIWNIDATRQLVRLVKNELPDAIIILGGPEVSYIAAVILREEPLVNYVISGEGEKPLALLFNAIFSGAGMSGNPGLSYRAGGEVIESGPNVSSDDPPSPYTAKYLSALKGRIAYLETSRGCPYSCSFCLSGYGKARSFNIERAKRDIIVLANSGTRTIKLVDRTFNSSRERAAGLIRYIIENYDAAIPKGVCFHFEIAGDILDEAMLSLLQTAPAGLIQFEIGIQSFNAETLASINRKTNIELLKSNIKRIIAKGNVHVHVDIIAGLPYENLRSFAQGFDAAYGLRPNMLQLGFLKLLYGSPMQKERQLLFGSFSKNAPYEVLETPWLSAEELTYLHRTEDAAQRIYNSGRFRRTLEYLLEQTGNMPFELFGDFAEHLKNTNTNKISLDDYIALVFEYFGEKSGVDKMTLRDKLVCDYLATNSSGKLPRALRIEDAALKQVKYELGHAGKRRGIAILYSEPCAVLADYEDENPVIGEYPLTKITI